MLHFRGSQRKRNGLLCRSREAVGRGEGERDGQRQGRRKGGRQEGRDEA